MRRDLAALVLLVSAGAAGAAETPRFEDFPAKVYSGKVHKPILDTADKRDFKTRLNEAAKGRPDFAGHYIVAKWGCGASCVSGALIDAESGAVTFLPWSVCCTSNYDVDPLQHSAGSSLLVAAGLLNEEEPDAMHYFEMQGGGLKEIATVPN